MNATFYPEEYYRKHQKELFEKYKKDCDYEHELKLLVSGIDFTNLPDEMREKAERICDQLQAKRIYEANKAELVKKMKMIREIKEGRASLGYISKMQEVREWHDLNEGFGFSCFMLAQFKEKYSL